MTEMSAEMSYNVSNFECLYSLYNQEIIYFTGTAIFSHMFVTPKNEELFTPI